MVSLEGHNFASLAGGEIAALQQLALQPQQQFYPPIGMIHPVTGGDTTTDSGSLYTTPPALCPILAGTVPRQHNEGRSGLSVASSDDENDEAAAIEAGDEEDDENDNRRRGPPVARAERNSVTASSTSDGVQRNSISTTNGGGGGDESISVEAGENSALLRPSVSSSSNGTNGRRKRLNRHRKQRTGGLYNGSSSSRTATESLQTSSTSGFPRTMLQPPFGGQPFPNIAGSDMLGTEYASTSLFGSSTASNNGISSTTKKGSSPLISANGGVMGGQYPPAFLQNGGGGSQNSATTAGGTGSTGTASYHLYQPILVPAQQAHLFQNAVAAAAAAAAAGGFMDSQQLGGLVQTSPFLSQSILHSAVPQTVNIIPTIVQNTVTSGDSM